MRSTQVAAGLIRDVGFDPVDAGPLRIARYTEPFALLMDSSLMTEQMARNLRTA
jgi:predicted dinucleotide-binding enzyme